MKETFFCGSCGKHKPIELKISNPGKTPKCISCIERINKILKRPSVNRAKNKQATKKLRENPEQYLKDLRVKR